MKFVDSLNKKHINIIEAFNLLGYGIPDYYKRSSINNDEWGRREMPINKALKYAANILNIKI